MVRAVFFGTAEIACPSLSALAASGFAQMTAVVSQPDRPSGRDLKVQPTPVKARALELGLPVLQPERARGDDFLRELRELAPEVIVVMAYGQILPQALLDIPKHGCVNLHTSILPKYRGAAPIQWAILNGDSETGVTLMKMDAGMDTGAMIAVSRTPVYAEDDAQSLHDRLGQLAAKLLVEKLPSYISGELTPRPQPEGATHARKISKEDGKLNWAEPAVTLWNRVRALTPWPGTFTLLPTPKLRTLKIWKAAVAEDADGSKFEAGTIMDAGIGGILVKAGQGALRLIEVQREGGRRMAAGEFLKGTQLRAGEKLG